MAKIIFFGTPEYVKIIPEALLISGHEIVAVVTQPPKPHGRNKEITPSPIAIWAEKKIIPVITDFSNIAKLEADLGVVASFGRIIPKEVLDLFPKGMLNIHPSLLPKYRGACPIQNAILDGIKESGVTIIKMDKKMDHGLILSQQMIEISDSDSLENMLIKSFKLGSEMLVNILPDYLKGKTILKLQDESEATYTWKTAETKEKAYFDLNPPVGGPPTSEVLDQMARAFHPWPNAWTYWEREATSDKRKVIVKLLPNKMLQMEGKKPVSYKQFLEGYPKFPKILGDV